MRLNKKEEDTEEIIKYLEERSVSPEEINNFLKEKGTAVIHQKVKGRTIASRPQIELGEFLGKLEGAEKLNFASSPRRREIIEAAEIRIKYSGYITREKGIAEKIKRLEKLIIPDDIIYTELASISTEGRQKLERIRPATIGQATRISGVSSSDISMLIMYLGR